MCLEILARDTQTARLQPVWIRKDPAQVFTLSLVCNPHVNLEWPLPQTTMLLQESHAGRTGAPTGP